ncbi:MAG: hypothetical protein D6793_04320, partial [Thermoflexia bacterium]
KNTIPGDTQTALATGIRMGTPWVTQRGLDEEDMDTLADLIARLLFAIQPFVYNGLVGTLPRGKVDLDVLEEVRAGVAKLAEKAGIDVEYTPSGYPHFFSFGPDGKDSALRVTGWRARPFVQQVVTANIADLEPGQARKARMLDRHGGLIAEVIVGREEPDEWGRDRYLIVPMANGSRVAAWLRALSDGYVLFDETDIYRKVEGPVVVEEVPSLVVSHEAEQSGVEIDLTKPYFIGQSTLTEHATRNTLYPEWRWEERESPLKRTPLYETHKRMGAKMVPFAGWEMPVWYTSVGEEHRAVRETAGLFDVAHMGVFEIAGPHATAFLDAVCSNYVAWLEDGQSLYGYLLDPDGN